MTAATKVLLAHLRQHVGNDSAKRKALLDHLNAKLPAPIHRGTLHKYIHGQQEPGADVLIPIMRWLQLEGVIKPGAKDVGLFIYTRPLRAPVGAAQKKASKLAKKQPLQSARPARKRAAAAA